MEVTGMQEECFFHDQFFSANYKAILVLLTERKLQEYKILEENQWRVGKKDKGF